ncbi:MAG: asparagine synthase (glutamine-hydrolyzing) [Bacteroidales bacterium]|nr:asparagine synthase (glutamine-hydrolyzing) [Bacteroidales bacterium]
MCGIAGIINSGERDSRLSLVKNMLSRIHYRGPDESGIYHCAKATLGNVRLSIIDLSGGQQPISDSSGRYWIVFNGEIFNYIELKADLEQKGYRFKTTSDTEVLVQLYAVYGKNCLEKLIGQFVFAIWDNQKEELFMARDRVGIRPLFYHYRNNQLTFASEIKCIFENPAIERQISKERLGQVFTYWTTITPASVFDGIDELSPGHYLVWNKSGIKTERYWQLTFSQKNKSLNPDDYIEAFDELFADSIRIRLRADVPVAAYLSGGLDSSATVSYINKIEPKVLNTFSITFGEKDFDESSYQNEAVKYFNTNHKSINCTSKDIAEYFPKVVWHSEIPMIRTAPTPMMLLSKLVRDNNIKVVITGEGADEMLAGYNIFKESEVRRFWARNPQSAFRPLLLTKLYPYLPQMQNANPKMLKMFFGYKLEDTANPLYSHLLRWNNSGHISKYLSGQYSLSGNGYDPKNEINRILPEGFSDWDSLSKAQWLESTVFMSGYLLSTQGDRMGMANSIEGRYPFLDHRLIEFLADVPSSLKLKGLQEKYLLKKLVAGKIPDSILKRSKQAYRAPIASVFFSDNLPDYIKYMLSDGYLAKTGMFNPESVKALINKIKQTNNATETENMAIAAIVSSQMLHYQFIENKNEGLSVNKLVNLKLIEQ